MCCILSTAFFGGDVVQRCGGTFASPRCRIRKQFYDTLCRASTPIEETATLATRVDPMRDPRRPATAPSLRRGPAGPCAGGSARTRHRSVPRGARCRRQPGVVQAPSSFRRTAWAMAAGRRSVGKRWAAPHVAKGCEAFLRSSLERGKRATQRRAQSPAYGAADQRKSSTSTMSDPSRGSEPEQRNQRPSRVTLNVAGFGTFRVSTSRVLPFLKSRK